MNYTSVFQQNIRANKRIVVNQGGTSCFDGSQLVITKRGSIPIEDIIPGDIALCYNEYAKRKEWCNVLNTFRYNNTKPTIRVTLKNGETITATEDHKIYYDGGWYSLKHLISLRDGNMEKDTKIYKVRSL